MESEFARSYIEQETLLFVSNHLETTQMYPCAPKISVRVATQDYVGYRVTVCMKFGDSSDRQICIAQIISSYQIFGFIANSIEENLKFLVENNAKYMTESLLAFAKERGFI